jgi:hypothetical protein
MRCRSDAQTAIDIVGLPDLYRGKVLPDVGDIFPAQP